MKLEAFNIEVDESQVYFKKLKKELVLLFCNPIIPGGQKWNTAWEINQTCPEGTLVVRRVYKMQAKNYYFSSTGRKFPDVSEIESAKVIQLKAPLFDYMNQNHNFRTLDF